MACCYTGGPTTSLFTDSSQYTSQSTCPLSIPGCIYQLKCVFINSVVLFFC